MKNQKIVVFLAAALGLLILPILLQSFGNAWVRIADMALLFVLLSLGLNIVVGYAGLLDLGYVAFFAIARLYVRSDGFTPSDRHIPVVCTNVP
jgi:branched-chain amino acid transport system permease protein